MKVHELKCWPPYLREIQGGEKTFEFRKNDRGFQVGDLLLLKEWIPETNEYTGTECFVKVTYGLFQGFGLPDGYCILQITTDTDIGHVCLNWCDKFPHICEGLREPCDCDDFRGKT
jgi:hypothetical protein